MSSAAQTKQKKDARPELLQITIKSPDWSYAHLRMIYDPPFERSTDSAAYPPDILTWRTTLTGALTQFLGIMGSAIHIDILHTEHDEAWLRLPRNDASMFGAAVSGYVDLMENRTVGFKTLGMSDFLMGIVGRGEEDGVWGTGTPTEVSIV